MSSRRWRGCRRPIARGWRRCNAALLVPIFAGGSDPRPFVGLIALGQKRSEEPYTPEDRELLRGIAVQMGVALDLSRLRKQVGAHDSAPGAAGAATQPSRRPWSSAAAAASAIGVGAVVDGKYRVDAMIGQGGMGAVFRAWDVRLERAGRDQSGARRSDLRSGFARCASAANRRSSRGCSIRRSSRSYDYGNLADGAAFLVMEFVPGEDLRQLPASARAGSIRRGWRR